MTRMKRMRQRRKRIAFDDENMTRGEREKNISMLVVEQQSETTRKENLLLPVSFFVFVLFFLL